MLHLAVARSSLTECDTLFTASFVVDVFMFMFSFFNVYVDHVFTYGPIRPESKVHIFV